MPLPCLHTRGRILVQVTIYRRLLIGRDGHLDQSEAYDISQLVREYGPSCTQLPERYNIHGKTHTTIKVTVQLGHEPYQSNGDTFDTTPLRIIRTTLQLLQYSPYKT